MRKFNVPPYCGVPSEFHQLAADVVGVVAVGAVEVVVVRAVATGIADVTGVVCVVVWVFVVACVVVEVLQDASISVATRRQGNAIHLDFPFMATSFIIGEFRGICLNIYKIDFHKPYCYRRGRSAAGCLLHVFL
jgi:hypothetical protein